MSSALDMSLDDLIKNNKQQKSDRGSGGGGGGYRSRGGGGGSGRGTGRASNLGPIRSGGPARRFPNRSANRAAPYSAAKSLHERGYDIFGGDRASAIETGTKLYVSNLDYGVSNEDIKELFSEVGDLKKYSIHYDRSGRSKGTAEVVFSRRTDAAAAVKRYNNVQLDGKPMKIEIVGTNIVTPAIVPAVTNGIFGNPNGFPRRGQGRGGAMGRPRGGSRGGGRSSMGRGRGRGRGRGKPVSVDDLDADLEKYHTEAMQVN